MDFKKPLTVNGVAVGTVSSVDLTVPSFLSVAGNPITTAGTLAVTLASQSANLVFAGPASGVAAAPTFRALVANDIPAVLNASGIRAAIGSNAAGLHIPWITGDALPGLLVGSTSSSNNQIAIQGISYSNYGVYGRSTTAVPVFADRLNVATNNIYYPGMQLRLGAASGVTPVANFGLSIDVQLMSDTTGSRAASQLATFWSDPADATRTAAYAFSLAFSGTITERMRLTGAGLLGIGAIAPVSQLHTAESAGASTRGITIGTHVASVSGALLNMRKSRGTLTAPAAIATGDYIGAVQASPYDGSAYLSDTAGIYFLVNGTVASGSVPTDIVFGTAAASSAYASPRMTITAAGNVGIGITAPTALLHVKGASGSMAIIEATSAASAQLELRDGAGTPNRWSAIVGVGTTTDGKFGIYDARQALVRVTIDTAGNFGIGTNAPSSRFVVKGTTVGLGGFFDADAVAAGEVQIVAAGGCVYAFTLAQSVLRGSAGAITYQSNLAVPVPGSGSTTTTIATDGASTLGLKVYATGQVTILRTAGTSTFKVATLYVAL